MDITRDIQTLSDFKQNASKMVKQVQETRQPMVLTVNGRAAVVVQDSESYQKMADDVKYWENVRVLKERIAYVDKGGEMIPAEEAFDKLSKKLGIEFE